MDALSSLTVLQGRIQQLQGQIGFEGCAVSLDDGQVFHVPHALKPHLFQKGQVITLIYTHQSVQTVYAILSHQSKTLYLHPDIQQYDPTYLKRPFLQCIFAMVAVYFFGISFILAWQLIINGDVFYADLADHLRFFHLPLFACAVIYFVTRFKDTHQELSQQVFHLLNFPTLHAPHLRRLQACNSYFEVYPHLFDVAKMMPLLETESSFDLEKKRDQDIQQLDEFHFSAWQRERFTLRKISGVLQQLKKQNVPYSEVDTDPYIEIQAVVNGIQIYGYVDEFHLMNKHKVEVLISILRDEKGHYFWYLHDQKRYIYLDEDQPVLRADWKIGMLAYAIVMVIMFVIAFFFAVEEGWAAFMVIFLSGMVLLTLIFILLYVYTKLFDRTEKYPEWIAQHIEKEMKVQGVMQLQDFLLYRIMNPQKERASRTGYDLMNKRE